jgi:hypothetical protein
MLMGSRCDDLYVREVGWTLRPYRLHAAPTRGGVATLAPFPPLSERRLLISSHLYASYNHTRILRGAYPYFAVPSVEAESTQLSRRNKGPPHKAVLGNEPVPHTVPTYCTHITAQPRGRVSTPTYERGVAKEFRDRTVHIPSSRFLKVYKSEL